MPHVPGSGIVAVCVILNWYVLPAPGSSGLRLKDAFAVPLFPRFPLAKFNLRGPLPGAPESVKPPKVELWKFGEGDPVRRCGLIDRHVIIAEGHARLVGNRLCYRIGGSGTGVRASDCVPP
jgi:hypothetical protein